ncbi:hypothetical protein SAMN06265365_102414 [Tistlia consotensis]|uniref:PLD-like domain-containing protein n=1 Tax=Tistlia consotensis USBA 355 TaxID=560819 RepID=A0A1Y6C0X7_9PROT|nr:phosphatidylserine/phosphatidylglycerophosphate/cardiolipin synthase family protein [Tistlia consotensis]SMF38622.1 hypothetical protein SAMN05428998_11349 [Tistlia consotensis USBA 355]SNR36986.1 hypothetical protein SAMN06265365_102414 [Tistlia consotensis]
MDETSIPAVAPASYPPRPGNRLQPLVDGIPAFRRIAAAVEAARHSVWLLATFAAADFPMPDGRGSLLDLLDRAAARGLDVRAIFWRPDPESSGWGQTFAGTPADRALLAERGSAFAIRWDRAPAGFWQHQKCWLVDAGRTGETVFLGGMNPTPWVLATPGHPEPGGRHDLALELAGPAASDLQHNFVQRWNEASERAAADGLWGEGAETDLPFPTRLSVPAGGSLVQIQRMLPAGWYGDAPPAPGTGAFGVAEGERTILRQ